MQIIISQQGIKRKIDGPFEICIGKNDLRVLLDRLEEIDQDAFCYGWVTIFEKPIVLSEPNQAPRPWKDAPHLIGAQVGIGGAL